MTDLFHKLCEKQLREKRWEHYFPEYQEFCKEYAEMLEQVERMEIFPPMESYPPIMDMKLIMKDGTEKYFRYKPPCSGDATGLFDD